MNSRKFVVFGLLALAFLMLIGTSAFAIVMLSKSKSGFSALSAEEQRAILQKIALNNPSYSQLAMAGSAAESALSTSARDTSFSADRLLIAPGWVGNPDLNYFYSKTSVTRGPAFAQCTYGIDPSENIFVPVVESYNFSDNLNYYSKYLAYNEDGSINNYSLSTSSNDNTNYRSENYTYLGGSYAVKYVYDYPVNILMQAREGGATSAGSPVMGIDSVDAVDNSVEPVSGPVSPEEPVEPSPAPEPQPDPEPIPQPEPIDPSIYFGPDVQILRTENINGRNYYVIQYSYQVDCAGYQKNKWRADAVEDIRTIYVVSYADTENYQVIRVENYLGSVSAGSLMDSSTTETQNQKLTFADVSSRFVFDLNVPVREIVADTTSAEILIYDPEKELQKQLDSARSSNLDILLPTAAEVTNQYLYISYNSVDSKPQENNYYADRNFYAQGAVGEKMYQMYNGIYTFNSSNYYPQALSSLSYLLNENNYALSAYSKSEDSIAIIDSFLWSNLRNKQETATTVKVNGVNVSATLYSYEYEQFSMMPLYEDRAVADNLVAPAPPLNSVCGEESCWLADYILVFEYGNSKYALKETPTMGEAQGIVYNQAADGADFQAYNTLNAADLSVVENLLRDALSGQGISGFDGVAPTL